MGPLNNHLNLQSLHFFFIGESAIETTTPPDERASPNSQQEVVVDGLAKTSVAVLTVNNKQIETMVTMATSSSGDQQTKVLQIETSKKSSAPGDLAEDDESSVAVLALENLHQIQQLTTIIPLQ